MKRVVAVASFTVGAALAANCSVSPSSMSPVAPTTAAGHSTSSGNGAAAPSHGIPIAAILGTGDGTVNVTPTAAVDGSFSAQIEVNVHGTSPNTTLYVQRAPEIGRPNGADGVCQRAAGQSPWGPPTPNFVTFPLPASGPLVTLTTSEGGAGAAHLDFAAPTIADDTRFDVMFRLVDNLTSPTIEMRSACFTVTVR